MTAPIEHAGTQAKREWDYSHSRGLPSWFLRTIGATRRIKCVWINEYSEGDWNTAPCRGKPIRIWRYEAKGLMRADERSELDHSAIASRTPMISFCADAAAERMIYQEWHGVRAEHGSILVQKGNGQWATEKCAWIS